MIRKSFMIISHSHFEWFGRTQLLDHLFLLLFFSKDLITDSVVITLFSSLCLPVSALTLTLLSLELIFDNVFL